MLWLELKVREGLRSEKYRMGISPMELRRFLGQGRRQRRGMSSIPPPANAQRGDTYEVLRNYLDGFDAPLQASCRVHFRRRAWEDAQGSLRVTMDSELRMFGPPELWARDVPTFHSPADTPTASESRVIVELKSLGEVPSWWDELEQQHGTERSRYSKFCTAARAALGVHASVG